MDILDILLSPCCNTKLLAKDGRTVCASCGKRFPVDCNCVVFSGADERKDGMDEHNPSIVKKIAKAFLGPILKVHDDKLNSYYDQVLTDKAMALKFREKYLPFPNASDKLTVLDFGCGRGRICAMLTALGCEVVGADILYYDFWKRIQHARFVRLSALEERVPFRDGSFDLCTHYMVLGYLRDPLKNLKEIKRVLKKGAYINIQVANKSNLYTAATGRFVDPGYHLSSVEELKEMISHAGFELCDMRTYRFYAPVFPQAVNFLRFVMASRKYDPFCDEDSMFVRLTPPKFRAIVNILARA